MPEQKFVDGLFVNRRDNAPEFLVTSISFNQKFIDYLKANFNLKGYCNIDVLKSKEGKLYAKLNDWQPKSEETFVKKDGKVDVDGIMDNFQGEEINPEDVLF